MRYPEIDIVKGIAVIFMVIFHFFYLAYFMDVKKYPIDKGILRFLAKAAHTTFIFMVVVNLALGYQRYIVNKKDNDARFGKSIKRSFFLYLAGIIVSIFSYLAFKDMFVKFGIFHFIATAIVISQLVVHSQLLSLVGAGIVSLIHLIKNNFSMLLYDKCQNIPFICFITGLYNIKYSALDHFPIIPWLAVIFMGIFFGHTLYSRAKRNFNGELIDKLSNNNVGKTIGFLGKHSLSIYFIHFPLFYFILYRYKKHFMDQTPILNPYDN